ncbi:MAG: tetratricopeptide repeat protein [Rhodocyclales bacterium]|nr:tetratricopeptide repeat protein [Rhodocyclales bacterium]
MDAAAASLFFEGNRHLAAGRTAPAEACFRRALALAPELAEAHANLALLLEEKGEPAQADACYRQAIALNPRQWQIHLNHAGLLAGTKRFAAAETAYRRALALRPQSAAAWSSLGVLLACCKRDAEAEQCYRQALALDGDYALARFNFSYLLLRQGRFDEGWPCLEARDWYAALAARLPCPRWQDEALAGKSLLICLEAGHGDMIQFCRYAAVLKSRGAARITAICHPALKTLFAGMDGIDRAVGLDEPLPDEHWDYWVPPLSLPFHCRTTLATIPATLPYLRASPGKLAQWSHRLPAGGVRVGLVWQGNSAFENDADRSLFDTSVLAPLQSVGGIRYFSLQKGGDGKLPTCLDLIDLAPQIDDFADTAAIVARLDLVIAVDTAVAHLAGALGKACWVLLPWYKTDWRWLDGRSDSPWYPGVMRLFRQPAMGDWGSVIAEVRAALAEFAAARGAA